MVMIGRNVNSNTEATVTRITINSVTATTIAAVNGKRIYFSVCLAHGTIDVDAAIRLYPTAQDNNKDGEILTRHTLGNANLFRPSWTMLADNIYTGEISAISITGTFDLIITEY